MRNQREAIQKTKKGTKSLVKRKSIFVFVALICVVMLQAIFNANLWSLAAEGDGKNVNVYIVEAEDNQTKVTEAVTLKWEKKTSDDLREVHITGLKQIRDDINANATANTIYYLDSDISLSDTSTGYEITGVFMGILEGMNHKISNLGQQALFETIGTSGIVKNLNIEVSSSHARADHAGVAYTNNGMIDNCTVTGSMGSGNSAGNIGGIVCDNQGIIKNCTNGAGISAYNAAGIAYRNSGEIINSYNEGTLTVANSGSTVGVAGIVHTNTNSGIINYCYNNGIFTGANIGGIAFKNEGIVKNSYNKADITKTTNVATEVAGIVAEGYGNIENCYNFGNITVSKASSPMVVPTVYVAGILAHGSNSENSQNIQKCYNSGNINVGTSSSNAINSYYVGGIVGQGISADVSNCYNSGEIKAFGSNSSSSSEMLVAGIAAKCNSVEKSENIGTTFASGNGAESQDISCFPEGSISETPEVSFEVDEAGKNSTLIYKEERKISGNSHTTQNGIVSLTNLPIGIYEYQLSDNELNNHKVNNTIYEITITGEGRILVKGTILEDEDSLKIPLEKKETDNITFEFKIKNKDNCKFLLAGTEFILLDQSKTKELARGTTNKNGETTLVVTMPANKVNDTVGYYLTQNINEDRYTKVERLIGIMVTDEGIVQIDARFRNE